MAEIQTKKNGRKSMAANSNENPCKWLETNQSTAYKLSELKQQQNIGH